MNHEKLGPFCGIYTPAMLGFSKNLCSIYASMMTRWLLRSSRSSFFSIVPRLVYPGSSTQLLPYIANESWFVERTFTSNLLSFVYWLCCTAHARHIIVFILQLCTDVWRMVVLGAVGLMIIGWNEEPRNLTAVTTHSRCNVFLVTEQLWEIPPAESAL